MSHRLHHSLAALFEHKESGRLEASLNHPDFILFKNVHGLQVPDSELVKAFTHTSFSHEYHTPHQEQIEFLGDAVLQLILTEEICRLYPEEKEGRLSKLRSSLVNEKTLAILANQLGLGGLLLVGRGEFIKRLFEQEAVLADTLEALIAQVYRFHGLEFTRALVLEWFNSYVPGAMSFDSLMDFDAKSKVQELSLARFKKLPRYSSEARGEKFEIELWINDVLMGSGIFSSKRNGEKELAQEVLKKMIND